MLDFIINCSYYNSIAFTIGVATFLGLELVSDPENFFVNIKQYGTSTAYWCANKFLEYKVAYDEKIHPYIKKLLNSNQRETLQLASSYYKKHIENDNVYYAETHITSPSISSPFMSFSVLFNGNEIDVLDKLKQFMVVGNMINDEFLAAFFTFYGFIPSEEYSFDKVSYSYITKDCNIETPKTICFKVLSNDAIELITPLVSGNFDSGYSNELNDCETDVDVIDDENTDDDTEHDDVDTEDENNDTDAENDSTDSDYIESDATSTNENGDREINENNSDVIDPENTI
jgi:hypothetical protein